jgi:hypothetical protein
VATEDTLTLTSALTVVSEAEETGVDLDVPAVRAAATAAMDGLVVRAVASRRGSDVEAAVALVDLLGRAGVAVDGARAQETVYEASVARSSDELVPLGVALGLAMGDLGVPL